MTNTQPNVNPMGKYNTTDTCKALGVCYNTLMSYVRDGLIRPVNGRRRRMFTGMEIISCWRRI